MQPIMSANDPKRTSPCWHRSCSRLGPAPCCLPFRVHRRHWISSVTRREAPKRGCVVPTTRNLGRNLHLYDEFLGSTDRIACRKFLRATSYSSWCKTYQVTSSSAACSEAQGSILGSSCFICSNPIPSSA